MGRKIAMVVLLVILIYSKVYAGFNGPFKILSTTYGNGSGQVGLQFGDTGDMFPFRLAVSAAGRIAICDEVNDRVVIFKSDGSFERSVNILSTSVVFDSEDSLYFEAEFRKFDKNGNMVFVQDVGFDEIFITYDNKIVGYDKDKKTYSLYSPTGKLLKTSTERPLELGRVSEQSLGEGRYKTTVRYPDKIYSFIGGPFEFYVRDSAGHLNAVSGKFVKKISECGKELGRLSLPKDQSKIVQPGGGGFDEVRELIAEYGSPVIAPNGDVYTWKRTPDKYSILKWTWVDDPNVPTGPDAPSELKVTPAINGLYLTWKASPQDPGCVTRYEVARATASGGPYTTIATVDKGMLKYNDTTANVGTMYYYKVRAMAGKEYSPYTSEVSGKR